MKILVIGGNRFVGLRLTRLLDTEGSHELHIVNRTGQAPHAPGAVIHKLDRKNLQGSYIDRDWDAIVDFAGYDERDARSSVDFFTRVGRYVLISTASVYDGGSSLDEDAFKAETFNLASPASSDYSDGKRRAEAVFAQAAKFPLVCVRFPYILGPDDYTERLKQTVERIAHRQPLNPPNPDSRFSLIHSEEACRFLRWAVEEKFVGPINVASPSSVSFRELIQECERATGKKAISIDQKDKRSHQPFGGDGDIQLNLAKLKKLGFECADLPLWLPQLIAEFSGQPTPRRLH